MNGSTKRCVRARWEMISWWLSSADATTVFAAFHAQDDVPAGGAYCRAPASSGRIAIGVSRRDPVGTPNHAAGRYAYFRPSG